MPVSNLEISANTQPAFFRVQAVAEKQSCDKVYPSRLGKIGRKIAINKPILDCCSLLDMGRIKSNSMPRHTLYLERAQSRPAYLPTTAWLHLAPELIQWYESDKFY